VLVLYSVGSILSEELFTCSEESYRMCMSNYVRFRNLNNEARAELLYQLKSMLYDVFLGTAVFGLLEILVLFGGWQRKI
jgi:hypothetical protein